MNAKNYDVIIVGGGIAGLYAAINLSKDLKILLLSKRELTLCNSALAQGGIAGVYKNDDDSPELHKNDTFIAGGHENNEKTLDILVNEAKIDIGRIIELGAVFDKLPNGDYHRTLEGGHGKRRIFHYKDSTGFEILRTLIENVKKLPNVDILENAQMFDLKKTKTGFSVAVIQNGEYLFFNSHFTILATGGIGRIYQYTTNSAIATGDGIALAYELGAEIENLSYIQFHPTAFHNGRECFLISEAVRGEGAYLLNCRGERFMHLYDNRLELAPRDVVSHSIIYESQRTNSDKFYLNISHKDPEFIKTRFPMIYKKLLDSGYDMTKDNIPIFPCQHYLMGGIKVDADSETTIRNLYACGECSHTGVHGNNRLASNSLLEALVFSRRAATKINSELHTLDSHFESFDFSVNVNAPFVPKGIRTKIRAIMQKAYFVIPNVEAILSGYKEVGEIMELFRNTDFYKNHDYVDAKSIVTVAYIVLKDAYRIATESEKLPHENTK